MSNLMYWIQRRTVTEDNGQSYEEVVFNETPFDYFKAKKLQQKIAEENYRRFREEKQPVKTQASDKDSDAVKLFDSVKVTLDELAKDAGDSYYIRLMHESCPINSLTELLSNDVLSKIPESQRYAYATEDRTVWVDFLGVRFLARLFRRSTHFFYGGNSYGVELSYLLSDYFGVDFFKFEPYYNPKLHVLKAFETGPRSAYYYEPFSISNDAHKLNGRIPAFPGWPEKPLTQELIDIF